jgi:hypothetical protein
LCLRTLTPTRVQAQFVAFSRDRRAALAAAAALQRQRREQREAAAAKAAAHAPFTEVRVPVLSLPPQAIALTTMRQFSSAYPLRMNIPPPPEEFVLGELPPRPPPPPALPSRPALPSLWLVNAPPFISPPPPPAPSHHERKRAQRMQAAEQARLRGGQQRDEARDGLGRRSLLVVAGERLDAAAGDDAVADARIDACCVPDPDVEEEDPLCSADRCVH